MIRHGCGKDSMTFADFRTVMTPVHYKPPVVSAALWADVPVTQSRVVLVDYMLGLDII